MHNFHVQIKVEMTKYKELEELPISSNTSHILYVSKMTKIEQQEQKNAKTLQKFEIFRQK